MLSSRQMQRKKCKDRARSECKEKFGNNCKDPCRAHGKCKEKCEDGCKDRARGECKEKCGRSSWQKNVRRSTKQFSEIVQRMWG